MRSRRAFTIIELLIVITIIAILLGLTVKVLGAVINASRESATQTTIRKIQSLLNSRAEALHRLQTRDSFVKSSPEWQMAGVYSTQDADRKIVAKKLQMRRYFPQRRQEVIDDDRVRAFFNDIAAHPKITATASASGPDVLYDIVMNADTLGDFLVGTDGFNSSEIGDTNNNGLPEFVDGWGNPLRFYRWPTRLFRPTGDPTTADPTAGTDPVNAKFVLATQPNLVNDLARDPDDPLRRCLTNVNLPPFEDRNLPRNNTYWPNPAPVIAGPIFHTPATYHVMLVVSAGPDGVLGLYEPSDTANDGHLGKAKPRTPVDALADDISYLSLRAGGK